MLSVDVINAEAVRLSGGICPNHVQCFGWKESRRTRDDNLPCCFGGRSFFLPAIAASEHGANSGQGINKFF